MAAGRGRRSPLPRKQLPQRLAVEEELGAMEGVDSLGGAEHLVIPDRIEGGTHLMARR